MKELGKRQLDAIQNPFMSFRIEDGVLFGEISQETPLDMDIDVAKFINASKSKLCQEKELPVFINFDGFMHANKAVREFWKMEFFRNMKGVAIYSTSPIVRNFFQFFIAVERPFVPMQVFSNKREGLNWLNEQ